MLFSWKSQTFKLNENALGLTFFVTRSMKLVLIFSLSSFVLSLTTVYDAHAMDFTAVQNGNWNDNSTWAGSVPKPNDTLTISSGITVIIPAGLVVTVDSKGAIINSGTITTNSGGGITNYGTLNNNAGGTIHSNESGVSNRSGGVITNNSGGTIAAEIVNSGTIYNSGTITSSITNNGGILNNSGMITGGLGDI